MVLSASTPMFDPASISNAPTAFVAGAITSLHCIGMCGPLACVLAPKPTENVSPQAVTTVYHLGRLLSYTLIGGLLGLLGQQALDVFNASSARHLPWMLVLFFVLVALRADRWMPKPRWLSRLVFRANARLKRAPRLVTGTVLGLLTPLLPCGPLYMVFGLALVMGSPLLGAEFLFAFGLGTLPVLFAVHASYGRWGHKLSPVWLSRLQRVTALAMALMIVWRMRGAMGGVGPDIHCPLCP